MAKVVINPAKLNAAAKQAFKDTCLVMGREFTQAISDPTWKWPQATARYRTKGSRRGKTPEIVGSPRDIVDTGQLRSSQQLNFVSDSEAVFSWNVTYALFAHEGWTSRSGNTFPGRPWVKKALEKTDPAKVFSTILPTYL